MEWISVKDRLPEVGELVCGYMKSTGPMIWEYFQYEGEPEPTWTLNSFDGNDGVDTFTDDGLEPTHWMPLPAPPKADTEKADAQTHTATGGEKV